MRKYGPHKISRLSFRVDKVRRNPVGSRASSAAGASRIQFARTHMGNKPGSISLRETTVGALRHLRDPLIWDAIAAQEVTNGGADKGSPDAYQDDLGVTGRAS